MCRCRDPWPFSEAEHRACHARLACRPDLVDYKLEFGHPRDDPDGPLVLGDEFTPDGCRLWDAKTGEKLDKDRFRRDLGSVIERYREVAKRIGAPL